MADQLTDSEAKMLRERCFKHGLLKRPDFSDAWPDPAAMAFGSDLLLAAKARAIKMAEAEDGPYNHLPKLIADKIRDSSWGDLFEVK